MEQEVTRIALHEEIIEYAGDGLQEFIMAVMSIALSTMYITCVVFLREHCKECLAEQLREPLLNWLNEKGFEYLREDKVGYDQLMRQIVIFTKEWTEQEMTEPCSLEGGNETHH